jgi:hypothetical protein
VVRIRLTRPRTAHHARSRDAHLLEAAVVLVVVVVVVGLPLLLLLLLLPLLAALAALLRFTVALLRLLR